MRNASAVLASLLVMLLGAALEARADERECLAAIAVLEAAAEGANGMEAVINVVRNRMADRRFPAAACGVIAQSGQFQPVGEWPALKRALAEPARLDAEALLGHSAALDRARAIAALASVKDRTGGALYFVNPRLMDPTYCPWFAKLRRTKVIGQHVFMTHRQPGDGPSGPALDCASPEIGSLVGTSLAARYANGLFHAKGARTASRTPSRRQLDAWQRTGRLEARQDELRRHFKPGWILLD